MAVVLVIEDDSDIREMQMAALRCTGHEVLTAHNGFAALELLERHRPCSVLLDVMMPGMDGLPFLAAAETRAVS